MKIKLDEGAFVPKRAHEDDAGYDLFTPCDVFVPAMGKAIINTGVHVELPKNSYGDIKSKSGLFFKNDIFTTGTVDAGYRGAIKVKLINFSGNPIRFNRGDKVAQMVITECLTPDLEVVEKLSETERGEGGFGSTGK